MSALVCIILLVLHSACPAAPAECVDAGMGEGSKHSCLDYACMNLCHMSHVRKKCALTCGACQRAEGGQKTVGLPLLPAAPVLVKREASAAVLSWALPASSCPVRSAELTFVPPLRGRKSFLVASGKPPFEYTAAGLLGDILYTVSIRVKSSFGWSPPSPELIVPRHDWGEAGKDEPTETAKVVHSSIVGESAAPTPAVHTTETQRKRSSSPTAAETKATSKTPKKTSPPPPKPASTSIRRTRKMRLKNPKNNEEIHKNKKYILIQRAKREAREHIERIERRRLEKSRGKGEL